MKPLSTLVTEADAEALPSTESAWQASDDQRQAYIHLFCPDKPMIFWLICGFDADTRQAFGMFRLADTGIRLGEFNVGELEQSVAEGVPIQRDETWAPMPVSAARERIMSNDKFFRR